MSDTLKDPKEAGPVPQAALINADVKVVEKTSDDSGYIVSRPSQTNPYVVEKGSALTSGPWGVTPGFIQGHTTGGNYVPSDDTEENVTVTVGTSDKV